MVLVVNVIRITHSTKPWQHIHVIHDDCFHFHAL